MTQFNEYSQSFSLNIEGNGLAIHFLSHQLTLFFEVFFNFYI